MAGYKAIVTGGAKGIGYAVSSSLLEAGGKVCVLDVLASEGAKATKTFDEKYGSGKAFFLQCDVSKKEQLYDAFHKAKSHMGGLNVVFNNAGVEYNAQEADRFEEMISVNLGAVIQGSMLGIELMGKSYGGNGGVIINHSSLDGVMAVPYIPIYSATKAGVVHFSRCISQTSQSDNSVRVNCVCPNSVYTDMLMSFCSAIWEGRYKPPPAIVELAPKTDEEARKKAMTTSDISKEVMKLIDDESKHGLVLTISMNPDDPTNLKVENLEFKY